MREEETQEAAEEETEPKKEEGTGAEETQIRCQCVFQKGVCIKDEAQKLEEGQQCEDKCSDITEEKACNEANREVKEAETKPEGEQ